MPSDAIWTSLITGSTAVFSGLLGYGAARAQPAFEARRAGIAQAHAGREARRTLYLAYLSVIDETLAIYTRGQATAEWWSEWWERMTSVDNRLELLGSSEARTKSYAVYNAIFEMGAELVGTSGEAFAMSYDATFDKYREAIYSARKEMITAMRRDVQDSGEA